MKESLPDFTLYDADRIAELLKDADALVSDYIVVSASAAPPPFGGEKSKPSGKKPSAPAVNSTGQKNALDRCMNLLRDTSQFPRALLGTFELVWPKVLPRQLVSADKIGLFDQAQARYVLLAKNPEDPSVEPIRNADLDSLLPYRWVTDGPIDDQSQHTRCKS